MFLIQWAWISFWYDSQGLPDPTDCKFKAKDYFPLLFKPALCLISPDIDILAKHHFSGTDIPKHVIKPIYIQEGEGYKSGLD